MFKNAKWIWSAENGVDTGDCVFRYTFNLEKRPKASKLTVAATGRCFVSVNGDYVLYAVGRDVTETETFYATADISRALKKGVNVIVARVVGGAETNGFALECDDPAIASGSTFTVYRSTASSRTDDTTVFNATVEHRLAGIHTPEFMSDIFKPVTEGEPADTVLASARPAPLFDAGKKRGYDKIDGGIVMETEPGAVYPRFTVTANSGDKVEITGSLSSRTLVYVAHEESQSFEFDEPLYGTLTFKYPSTVKLNEAGYRLVECGAERTGLFKCDEDVVMQLLDKAENTFRLCTAGAFTERPDSRTVTPLDASVLASAAVYTLTDGAAYLQNLMNALLDALDGKPTWVTTDNRLYTLYGLSGLGLHGDCAAVLNDSDLRQRALQATVAYLETFDGESEALRAETDGRYNMDTRLLVCALEYSAVTLCCTEAAALEITRYDDFLTARKTQCESCAETLLKNGGLTTTGNLHDDRANALAVLSGLAPQFLAGDAARVMATALNATPIWEGAVVEALFATGRATWAVKRMRARAAVLDEYTLPSDYVGEGEACRAAAAGYIGAFYRAIAGVRYENGGRRITVTPDLSAVSRIYFELPDGKLMAKINRSAKNTEFIFDNRTGLDVTLRLKLNKGIVTDEPVKELELKKGRNVFKF